MDIKIVIEELDRLNVAGREQEGVSFLEQKLNETEADDDRHGALAIVSELLGQYRRCGEKDKGLQACEKAVEMVKNLGIGTSVSGATVLINAATTMKAFGQAEAALPLFETSEQVYLKKLALNDYRIGALYNNMALAYEDVQDYMKAEDCFKKALTFLEELPHTECDRAVTCCSLAELMDMTGRGEDAVNHFMEKAYDLFTSAGKDGYLSFSIGKCLQAFDYFGFFLYAKKLREIKDATDELYR